ncbi:MAG: alpha-E domain-containing protein [Acidimicrobiia bacterium]|nr:alpha-E domain-containing protein [Acidimicrobiia bacterium]
MLSRIAESLFWIGRYVERAEDSARIIDVHHNLLLEDPWVDEAAACGALLDVMGVGADVEAPRAATVIALLALDETTSSSIVGALRCARENARGVREVISSEMWECLNATYHLLGERTDASSAGGQRAFFEFVKERAAVFAGLADSTMSRDDAWRFLGLGRSLERVDMTCRLLTTRWADATGSAGWVTTLRCCAAHEAYLRTYRKAVDSSLAAEFLLLDRLFPRSVYASLSMAERRLAELSPSAGRVGGANDARRILGRARTELEFRSVGELLPDLPEVLRSVQSACVLATDAIAARFFAATQAVPWHEETPWAG